MHCAFLVASPSVYGWWAQAAGGLAHSRALLLDERSVCTTQDLVQQVLAAVPPAAQLIFLSSHDSLQRDLELRAALEPHGFTQSFGISGPAASLGRDKI